MQVTMHGLRRRLLLKLMDSRNEIAFESFIMKVFTAVDEYNQQSYNQP